MKNKYYIQNKTKHNFRKEAILQNEDDFQFSRYQNDDGWWAYVESKTDDFYIFSGPWKLKRQATNQIRIWIQDDNFDF